MSRWPSAAEPGLAGVLVQLLWNGQVIANATTNANGQYSFPNLPPGEYVVKVTPPPGYLQSTFPTGQSPPFTLTPGQVKLDVDAGLTPGLPWCFAPCHPISAAPHFWFQPHWRPAVSFPQSIAPACRSCAILVVLGIHRGDQK